MQATTRSAGFSRRLTVVAVALALAVAAIWYATEHRPRVVTGLPVSFRNQPYAPQPNRNAEWLGTAAGPMSARQSQNLAKNVGYEVIPKFADGDVITQHFAEAHRLVAAAKAQGKNLRVFEYYNATFFPLINLTTWGQYAANFQSSWYLHDANGAPIPFYGAGRSSALGGSPVGYVMDLANPDYRNWVVSNIASWMKAAPYSGVAFDSARPLVGYQNRTPFGNGNDTFNELLCGPTTAVDANSDCPRVAAWNSGLTSLLSETSSALHRLGDEVMYNGIAPTRRGGTVERNLGLLRYTDLATNEGFCYTASSTDPSNLRFNSIADDAKIMQTAAREGKKLIEITNYRLSSNKALGAYCLAGFLMGWQPASDYWIYHESYVQDPQESSPALAEQNLALGPPATTGYQRSGQVYTRQFEHGMAAVNSGDSAASVTIPHAMVAFADGSAGAEFAAGQKVMMPPRSGLLLLTRTYLFGAHGH